MSLGLLLISLKTRLSSYKLVSYKKSVYPKWRSES